MEPEFRATRIEWVDHLKGFAMLFVVLGHALAGLIDSGDVPHPDWFRLLLLTIYVVHMPLFFFVSGLFVQRRVDRDSGKFVRTLGITLVWPYFLWGVIQVCMTSFAGRYANVPVGNLAHALLYLPVSPQGQFWFLYSLLTLHVLSGLTLPRLGPIGLLIAALALASLYELGVVPMLFARMCMMAPFYALGVLLGASGPFMSSLAVARAPLLGLLFFAAVSAVFLVVIHVMNGLGIRLYSYEAAWIAREAGGARSFFAAFAGIMAICAIFAVNEKHLPGWLKFVGQHSLSIYVLHIMCMAAARIVLRKFLGVQDPVLLLPILVAIGITAPLVGYALADRLRIGKYVALS